MVSSSTYGPNGTTYNRRADGDSRSSGGPKNPQFQALNNQLKTDGVSGGLRSVFQQLYQLGNNGPQGFQENLTTVLRNDGLNSTQIGTLTPLFQALHHGKQQGPSGR